MRVGQVIGGRFAVQRWAGAGRSSTVFFATDTEGGGPVALKIVRSGTPAEATRALLEAATLARIEDPRVVRYVAHGEVSGNEIFLATEWLDGVTVAERLRHGPLSVAEALALAEDAAGGLAAVHAAGVVHRDVTPKNLFLPSCGAPEVKVLDFGLVKRAHGGGRLTETGVAVGTLGYMPPEQLLAERDASPSWDVYALGCVLYECLCGSCPFPIERVAASPDVVLFEDPPPLPSRAPWVPAKLDHLVASMLARDPAVRPRDAGEVASLLRDLCGEAS